MKIPNPYASKHYYLLGVIPIILVICALFFIPNIPKGVDLKGGTLITVVSNSPVDAVALKATLSKYSEDVSVRQINTPSGTGLEIEIGVDSKMDAAETKLTALLALNTRLSNLELQASSLSAQGNAQSAAAATDVNAQITDTQAKTIAAAKDLMASIGSSKSVGTEPHAAVTIAQLEFAAVKQAQRDKIQAAVQAAAPGSSTSVREVGASLSKYFLDKAQQIVLYAFILAGITVLVVFRSIGPTIAVIFGAIADISITAGVMGILGVPLSLASIATLLMLIGFSLDTDVMLTIRVLERKEGTAAERAWNALKTGALMNATTIGAFGALLAIAYWLQVPTYQQIGAVAVIGAFADFIATWCFNASLVLYFAKKKEHKEHAATAA